MTKERFTYELIDKWLYLVSQQCVLMENYTQKDRTFTYERCTSLLGEFFDYYDQIYEKVDQELYPEEEIDARLEYLIQKLQNQTMKNIMAEIEAELCVCADEKKKLIEEYLLCNKEEKVPGITKAALIQFIEKLRVFEESQLGIAGE